MARRKDHLPPFEIMGSTPPRRPWHERGRGAEEESEPRTRESASPVRSDGVPPGQWLQWLSHAGPPLVLRVPRGLAISVVLGVLGLLVVAYWVGYERGESAATPQYETQDRSDRIPAVIRRDAGEGSNNGPTTSTAGNPDGVASLDAGGAVDPRTPGHNYMVMARRNRRDAQRLAQFVMDQGVETILVPLRDDMFLIVATERGFESVRSEEAQAYRNRLREIGRAWKRHNQGRGSELEDMYFARHDG
ncbi:MAG: hypothetical protein ACOC1G_06955 [Phycisphaeraceae bacterium]